MQPNSLTNRADLLRWIKRCQTVEEKQLVAQLLGYTSVESHKVIPSPQAIYLQGSNDLRVSKPVIKTVKDKSQPEQRPPECFYALTQRETYGDIDQIDDDLPACLRGVEPLSADDLRPFEQGEPLTHQPLVPEQRLVPFLRQTLSHALAQRLDIPRLIKQMVRLQVLPRVPRKPHVLPAGRVYILLDLNKRLLPFWQDAHALCELLVRKHGKNGLDIRVLEDYPNGRYHSWFDDYQIPKAWSPLKTPSVVLILSDLGQLAGKNSATQQVWLQFVRQLARQGICPVVLSPVAPQHLSPIFQNLVKQIPWGRQTHLKPQKPNQDLAQHKANVRRVLGLLAVAVHIEPELLRAILACLPIDQAGSGVEADVYLHEDVVWGYTAITLKPEKRDEYRALFRNESAVLQRQVLALLRRHHIGQFPAVWAEEVLNAQPLVNFPLAELADLKRAENFMQRFARSFWGQTQHTGMAQFARRHLQRLGKDEQGKALYQDSYSSVLYGLAHREQLLDGGEIPSVYNANLVLSALGKRTEPKQYTLIQRGEYLEVQEQSQSSNTLVTGVRITEFKTVHDTLLLNETTVVSLVFEKVGLGVRVVRLQAQTVTLDTGLEKLVITPLTKPSWASSLGRNINGLWAGISWLGEEKFQPWAVAESSGVGSWAFTQPFGSDQYGLYVDLTIKHITQRFRWINPGTFMMGSPKSEAERYDDEVQQQVTLTQGFWLADTTVTQALWQAVMGNNPSRFNHNSNNPVEKVSWNDIQDFIQKLNALIPSLQVKLPTEAQWEYACRAGTTTPFSFGDNVTPEQVNYNGNYPYANGKKGLYRKKTVPVKSFPANPWGLYEMHGNVWERCQGARQEKLSTALIMNLVGFTVGDQTGVRRVARGGSWFSYGRSCRSACRRGDVPDYRINDVGFRLLLGHESPHPNPVTKISKSSSQPLSRRKKGLL